MRDRLDKFMRGLAAAAHLLNVAVENRSALECIVLQANIIDGALRVGLILQAQLDTKNSTIDEILLYQAEADKAVSEREIYKRCLSAGVVDQKLFDALSNLYDKRNKCIHRYLLSDIDYDYAINLVFELDKVRDEVVNVIGKLESEQISRGMGMTGSGPPASKAFLREYAAGKEKWYNLGR